MRNLFKAALLVVTMMALTMPSFGQVKLKIGHINSNDLMEVMPGRDSAMKVLEAYATSLEEQLKAMNTEFQAKYDKYLAEEPTLIPPIKESRQKELVDLQNRITEFQETAQTMLGEKEAELVQPLIDKAKKAVEDVAKEKGYNYVFDTSIGALIYFDESDDLLPFVKAKLGIQ